MQFPRYLNNRRNTTSTSMVCLHIVGTGLLGKDYGTAVERYDAVK